MHIPVEYEVFEASIAILKSFVYLLFVSTVQADPRAMHKVGKAK